jgi:regulation of enolase protein 1 (concanavalin A-like superfamily)
VPAQIGVMCASPQGAGFTVRFEGLRVMPLPGEQPPTA